MKWTCLNCSCINAHGASACKDCGTPCHFDPPVYDTSDYPADTATPDMFRGEA